MRDEVVEAISDGQLASDGYGIGCCDDLYLVLKRQPAVDHPVQDDTQGPNGRFFAAVATLEYHFG